MKFLINVVAATALTFAMSATAAAGSFDAYSMVDQKSKRVVLVVSFAGDGVVEEAQLDLDVPAGYKLASAKAKVEGSVCVGIPGNKVRIVPPSGAGKALTSAATDYCSFAFAAEKRLAAGPAPAFKQSFVECAAVSGIKGCSANISDITQ